MKTDNKRWAPDFIGIGAMKSASYWIYKCLEAHPDVCVSSRKELHYFDFNYEEGEDWYKSFFSCCGEGKVCGEFTPDYMSNPDVAARIKKHYPNVKLIACLRNPVERAYSHYRFVVTRKGKMSIYRDFEHAVEKDEALVQTGLYFKQLKVYFDTFPKENILVLIYDDIKKDPARLLNGLYSFLEVDSGFLPQIADTRKGVTGVRVAEYRIPFLNMFLYRISDWIHGSYLDRVLIRFGIKNWINRLVQRNKKMVDAAPDQKIDFPPLGQETHKKLSLLFKDDVTRLEKLINRDLSSWLES